jgi:threonine/homoserine/homoserine lactone efflux protein
MLFIGAAYMLCLAWKTFRASDLIDDDERRGSFRSGLVLQFVNVKVLIYCIMSMEMYIVPYYQGQWPALILFALLLSFVGFLSTIIWALFGSLLKKLFSKYAKITNTIMALILVYLAIALFL